MKQSVTMICPEYLKVTTNFTIETYDVTAEIAISTVRRNDWSGPARHSFLTKRAI